MGCQTWRSTGNQRFGAKICTFCSDDCRRNRCGLSQFAKCPKSALFVPMIVGETVVGSVSLQNVEEEHAFTESDLQLITTLTNSMSVAIENARLFNETTRLLAETEQRATELQTVNRISQALVSQLEFDALINLVGELMKETFKADIVYVALHDRETDMIHFPFEYGDK
ncbi:MAG: GAF domain-containing protein, partial [Bacteroidetes bacterium]|nr:GAF domain-containing protein [Bacteroidota bacterium]